MWHVLNKRALPMQEQKQAMLPPGHRVYAIGDIHGRHDLLVQLQGRIAADIDPDQITWIVYLGDYIDRGPASDKVLEAVQTPLGSHATNIWLRGNHEQSMIDFLDGDISACLDWLQYGGSQTFTAFGISPPDPDKPILQELTTKRAQLAAALKPVHNQLLNQLRDSWSMGDYFFVHAGIRPGVPLDEQEPADLLWIRQQFLKSDVDHGKVIVHGHSVTTDIEFHNNRIGVDTGAVMTGCLTALVIDGASRRFLQTKAPARFYTGPNI